MSRDTDMVQKALAAAPHCLGLTLGPFRMTNKRRGYVPDGFLSVKYKNRCRTYAVEVKRHLHHALMDRLLADTGRIQSGRPLLVIADQIGHTHANMLIKAGVAFLDTAGNAFLDLPGLHLVVTGRSATTPIQRPNPGRAFQPTGLSLVFAFMTDPFLDADPAKALINQPYRSITQQTGVSLGSIGWILGDLQDAGFVVMDGKIRLLVDRKALLQKWVGNYVDRLRPKQPRRCYSAPSPDWWETINLDAPNQLWGGEVAAAKLTGFLVPQIVTVYARLPANNLILDAGLRLDSDGDVDIIDPFWRNWRNAAHRDCTHPLLVYADLLASDVDRNIEAARRVYHDHLRNVIEPD